MRLFVVVQFIVIATGVAFCFFGAIASYRRRQRERDRAEAYTWAATLILDGGPDLDEASRQLAHLHHTLLAEVLQPLAADTDGEAQRRLRVVAQHAGLTHRLTRMSKSRSWRTRVRAAHLLMLLPDGAPERRRLLGDPNPYVRARAIETMSASSIDHFAAELVAALGDPEIVVQSATQHALSVGGSACVPALIDGLDQAIAGELEVSAALMLVEIASEVPDPRLATPILRFIDHDDPRLRRLTANFLGNRTIRDPSDKLRILLADADADVRAEAVRSVGRARAIELSSEIGRKLGDRHWQVRREAGAALATLAPTGQVVLRTHLDSDDAFAADMARHILEQIEGRAANTDQRIAA